MEMEFRVWSCGVARAMRCRGGVLYSVLRVDGVPRTLCKEKGAALGKAAGETMRSIWQDLRFGLRQLRLSPGFAAVGILSLALGIGANTAIFQLIDAIRLRKMPVQKPEELAAVKISPRNWANGNFRSDYSDLTYPMWREIA